MTWRIRWLSDGKTAFAQNRVIYVKMLNIFGFVRKAKAEVPLAKNSQNLLLSKMIKICVQ